MTMIKKAVISILAITAVMFLCLFATAATTVYADDSEDTGIETELPDDTGTSPDEAETENGSGLIEQFKAMLKDKYGADYEFYYNQIIENWGSVEAYLLSLGGNLPEEYKTAWDKFVGWLGEYSVIWAPALAVVIVIIVAIVGKKQFNKIVERIVNKKLMPIARELNNQSRATIAMLKAQRSILPQTEKYTQTREELEQAEGTLNG